MAVVTTHCTKPVTQNVEWWTKDSVCSYIHSSKKMSNWISNLTFRNNMYVTVILYCIIKLERSALVTSISFVTNDFFRWSSPQPPELCSAAYNGQKLDKWLKLIRLYKVLFWFMSANLDHDAVPAVQETIHYGHFTLCFLQIQATHVSLTQDAMVE